MKTLLTFLAVFIGGACGSPAASIVTIPAEAPIQGLPGQVIGWGFQFDNDTPYFALLTGSDLTPPPSVGQYTDLLALSSNLIVVAPSSSFTQPFVFDRSTIPGQTLTKGLGLFAIDPNALPGQGDVGTIFVSYDLYSVDPNSPLFDPGVDAVSFGNTVQTQAGVTVSPEPSSAILAAIALSAAGLWRFRRTMH